MATISPKELAELPAAGQGVQLIDVRTPAEFREVHVDFARNIPLDRLTADAVKEVAQADRPVYFICRSGSRGKQACERLSAAGLNAINVEGGTLAWADAGLPVVRGKKTLSLERQVRIAAGSIVLISSILALLVHPYFAGLAAFVGAGLVFAGVTDTCGMALVLARMPWNQASGGDGTACCT
ncbi:MAG: rhodanese-like domain-containing protein [Pirellulales bacterium]|nr:rhodanese-like domain-containing protein [Pirellulales bacterium]